MILNKSNFIQIIGYLSVPENLIYSIVIIKYKNFLKITNRYETQLKMDIPDLNLNGRTKEYENN